MKKLLLLIALPLIIFSCKSKDANPVVAKNEKPISHPAWIMQGNIYEVNIQCICQTS